MLEEKFSQKERRPVSQIKYSDKARVQRFRAFAEKKLQGDGFRSDMDATLGELELTTELRDRARKEKERDSTTWEQRRWKGTWESPPDDHTLRWKISTLSCRSFPFGDGDLVRVDRVLLLPGCRRVGA